MQGGTYRVTLKSVNVCERFGQVLLSVLYFLTNCLYLSASFFSLLSVSTERVEKRVEGRVERQHKDRCPHVDLTRDWNPGPCHQTHDAHREPAAEVRDDNDEEAFSNDDVFLEIG